MLIAASVLSPILFTVLLGFALERARTLDARTLSSVSIFLLTPCLVFYSLLTTRLKPRDILDILLFLPGLTLSLWFVAKLSLRIRRKPDEEGTFMLCSLFMNAGNFGIPMCESAFGSAGVEYGVVWVIVQNALLFPLAVYFAARDKHGSAAYQEAFKMPVIYAVLLALALRMLGIQLPRGALETIRSIGYAMIPLAQILLGAQLGKIAKEARDADVGRLLNVLPMRLIVSPLLAIPLTAALGASGLTRNVLLLLSGAPIAVNMSVLAQEFDNEPHFIAVAIFFSTLLSFVTLGITLNFLH